MDYPPSETNDCVETKVSYEEFAKLADSVLEQGKMPSILLIRGLLNEVTVSNTEIADYLAEWQRQLLASPEQHPMKQRLLKCIHEEQREHKKTDDLEYSLALVRSTLESTTDGIMVVDKDGHIVDCNQKFIKMWGIPMDLVAAGDEQKALEHVMQQMEDPDGFYSIISKTYSDLDDVNEINEVKFKDGRIFELYSQPHQVQDHTVGRVWSARDVTQRKRFEAALLVRNLAIQASPNGVVIINIADPHNPRVVYANPAYERILRCSLNTVIDKSWHLLKEKELNEHAIVELSQAIVDHSESRVEIKKLQADGTLTWVEVYIAPVLDHAEITDHCVGILVDITEHKLLEQRLTHQATHDDLTNLPNRTMLLQYLNQMFTAVNRVGKMLGLVFIDLDEFKLTNDILGHNIGDVLLCKVADALRSCIRESDMVARWGGDEFVVVLPFLDKEEGVFPVINKIITRLQIPFKLQEDLEQLVLATASIGVSFYPKDGITANSLLKNADIAMYKSKELGRNKVQLFNDSMNQCLARRVEIERDLRQAILQEQFVLNLQPIVHLSNRRIVGFEALLRWPHPTKGMISPLEFIPIAEATDLIIPIGEWVIKTACEIYKKHQTQGLPHFFIAVNVSGRQIKQPDFLANIKKLINQTDVDPSFLAVEITESILVENFEHVANVLKSLQQLGIDISMDDFGTGYSSLSYLRQLPINKLKIDQSFIRDLLTDESNSAITEAIIAIARSLKMIVIAEGVEEEAQLERLLQLHCDEVQGYYFSRPVSVDDAMALLQKQADHQLVLPWPEKTPSTHA